MKNLFFIAFTTILLSSSVQAATFDTAIKSFLAQHPSDKDSATVASIVVANANVGEFAAAGMNAKRAPGNGTPYFYVNLTSSQIRYLAAQPTVIAITQKGDFDIVQ